MFQGVGQYSSNLLEVFNEKTEMLSRGGGSSGGGSSQGGGGANGDKAGEAGGLGSRGARRRGRGRPPKDQQRPPPELEAYPCQSNVSPDSGIQSVAGSPAHHPSPVASPDPHLRRRPPVAANVS